MLLNIDSVIFISFLVINLWFGLRSSNGIKNIREYAIGDTKFSTGTIVATTVATWVCGETFFSTITETYQHGLYFIISCIFGFVASFFIIGYYFAPRMQEFIGKLSIAEAMGELYGNKVRLITTISGFIGVSGFIAVQLKISGILFNYVFGLSETYGIIVSGLIITIYSSLGGIKSVTFTDVIQFFTFGTIIPTISFQVFSNLASPELMFETINANPNFDLSKVFDFSNSKSWYYGSIFFYCLVPCFNPATFQRVAMASSITQIKNVFYLTGTCIFFFMMIIAWFSLTILSTNPNVPIENLIQDHVFSSNIVGYKGLLLIGITAMVMSTADSYINCSSVLFTYDFCQSLKIKLKNELLSARIVSFLIGLSGILLAFKESSLFQLAIFTSSFFVPIVTVPFIMAILGYRTPYEKAVLYGMGAAFITVLAWNYYGVTVVDVIVPAMLVNLLTLVFMHYYYNNQYLRSQ